MDSNKSRRGAKRPALEPRRRPGKERVAALLEAAASLIAEKGYEATTMAEIAARAGALVGSLYHFFPNKEALADALIRRYAERIDEAFARIQGRAASMPIEALTDALLGFLVGLKEESKALVALLDARPDWLAKVDEFLDAILAHIVRTLSLRSPGLPAETAQAMAVVLLQNMKAMKYLSDDPKAASELREMTLLYLKSKFRAKK